MYYEYSEALEYTKKVKKTINENRCYERVRASKIMIEHMVRLFETGEVVLKVSP